MKRLVTGFTVLLTLLFVNLAHAGEFGTPEEAKAMAEAAAKFHAKNGLKALVEKVTAKDPLFKNKDLYVFVSDNKGVNIVHGAVPAFKGRDFYNLKDVSGVFLVREMIKTANAGEGRGWVDYKWPNPKTKKIRDKTTYVIKLTDDYWVAVGAYK